MDEKQIKKELLGRLTLRDKLLFRLSRYMPSIIRRRILVRYVQLIAPKALEIAFRQAKDALGDEGFKKMLDQIPIEIKDKDGTWILPSGTSREDVYHFLMRLREQEVDKEGGK